MALKYKCKDSVVELAIERMKNSGLISKNATYNRDAKGSLRTEVAYRDLDLLSAIGELNSDEEIVDDVLGFLCDEGFIPDIIYNKHEFVEFRDKIRQSFIVPWTTFTPAMERLLFSISSITKPKSILAIGIFCGNTLAWNIASAFKKSNSDLIVIGIDIDESSIADAKNNFKTIAPACDINLIATDGRKFLNETNEKFDYVYLDAHDSIKGKKIYEDLLIGVYPKLNDGGMMLAHDATYHQFQNQLSNYFSIVRDEKYFSKSVSLEIDVCGLELSVK